MTAILYAIMLAWAAVGLMILAAAWTVWEVLRRDDQ